MTLCFVSRNQKRPGRNFFCFLETKHAKNPGLFRMFPFSCVSTSTLVESVQKKGPSCCPSFVVIKASTVNRQQHDVSVNMCRCMLSSRVPEQRQYMLLANNNNKHTSSTCQRLLRGRKTPKAYIYHHESSPF